jgi:hypothetical protein
MVKTVLLVFVCNFLNWNPGGNPENTFAIRVIPPGGSVKIVPLLRKADVLCLHECGAFTDIQGADIVDDALADWIEICTKSKKLNETKYLQLVLNNERETSLATMCEGLWKLKQKAPRNVNIVLFFHFNGLSALISKTK